MTNVSKRIALLAVLVFAGNACTQATDDRRIVGQLASDRVELSLEFSERIVEIAVAEGESVQRDQVLLRLDDAKALAKLADANAQYRQAEARLSELVRGPRSEQIAAARATREGAEDELRFREKELARIRDIYDRGLTSTDTLDNATAAVDAARAAMGLRSAELDQLLAGTTIEELTQAEAALARMAALRDLATLDVERHVLKAPTGGIIDTRLLEVGERPLPNQAVITMLSGDQPYARVYVPEAMRVFVRAGTPAKVHADGLPEPIDGTVRWISSDADFTPYFALTDRDRGHLSFVAKVDILRADARLPDGVPVDVILDLERPVQ